MSFKNLSLCMNIYSRNRKEKQQKKSSFFSYKFSSDAKQKMLLFNHTKHALYNIFIIYSFFVNAFYYNLKYFLIQ